MVSLLAMKRAGWRSTMAACACRSRQSTSTLSHGSVLSCREGWGEGVL